LRTKDADNYFNTGIVLMNIQKLREERTPKEISEAVVDNKAILILPDQDVFNYLYFNEVKENPWEIYNVDPRLYQVFQLINPEKYNLGWVEDEVIFIHYAGKHKPWMEREKYKWDLGKYYFEYYSLFVFFHSVISPKKVFMASKSLKSGALAIKTSCCLACSPFFWMMKTDF